MREIKFRGKRFDNNHGNWIYGYLHVIDTLGEGYTGKAIQQQNGTSRPYSVRVHDDSVGQYTCLKDKNGTEIYEGDIISFIDGHDCSTENGFDFEEFENNGVIEWCNEEVRYTVTNRQSIDLESLWEEPNYIEVIGNIYDNPEFLERQQNGY